MSRATLPAYPGSQPHQCVGGNTIHLAPGLPQESLERDGTRTSLPAKPSTNLNDAGPIVRRPMGLPVPAGCDRAWTWTRISSGTASTAMQSLRPLLPSVADYLTTVTVPKLKTSLTMHRLSEHSLAIERGRGLAALKRRPAMFTLPTKWGGNCTPNLLPNVWPY